MTPQASPRPRPGKRSNPLVATTTVRPTPGARPRFARSAAGANRDARSFRAEGGFFPGSPLLEAARAGVAAVQELAKPYARLGHGSGLPALPEGTTLGREARS